MQTRNLRTLVTIAESGAFVSAARELNLTLSTVSMQMKGLEEQLSITLFDRSVRPPMLTPLGRRIAEKAREILATENELVALCSPGGVLSGVWRMGFVATASVRLLPGFIKKVGQEAPLADFEFETALSEVLEARVKSGQIDAAVVTASPSPPIGLAYLPLRTEPLVLALPATASDQTIEELATDLPFLQFNPGSGIGKLIESYMDELLPSNAGRIILDSVEAIMECVNEGIGFTLLTHSDIARYGTHGMTVRETGDKPLIRNLVLCVTSSRQSAVETQTLRSLFSPTGNNHAAGSDNEP